MVQESLSWAQMMDGAVVNALPQLTPSARALVVAHAAFESGWGSAYAARNGNNFFNITSCQGKAGCADGWFGPVLKQENADWEYRPDGTKVRIAQTWRAYGNPEESIADYWAFLGRTRYAAQNAQGALANGDPAEFASALSAAGYFTLPVDKYISRLTDVLVQVTASLGLSSVS